MQFLACYIKQLKSKSNILPIILTKVGSNNIIISIIPIFIAVEFAFLSNSEIENIICLPKTGEFIKEGLNATNKNVIFVEKLDEAVKIAKKVTKPGTVCLLSPAASSYGYFKNFEERGRLFKQYVLEN